MIDATRGLSAGIHIIQHLKIKAIAKIATQQKPV
jgi:hypothetical protein